MIRPSRGAPSLASMMTAAALCLVAGGAASAPHTGPRPGGSGADLFDDLYQRGQRANASIKTLTAHFTETTTSSLLTRPLTAHGTLAVERPSHVVLRYTDPEPRVVLIDAHRLTMSWPGRNITQATDIGAAQGRIQKYFVNGTADDLRRQFDIQAREATPDGERPGTYQVTMVPKRKQIREALTRLDLWIDRSSLLLAAMRMTFANGDTKMMAFDGVVPNAAIDPGAFTIGR
jgi:outer membrane lipoprotein-sorting protein